MSVTVKFFASLRERIGESQRIVDDAVGKTVSALWTEISSQPSDDIVMCAINQEYVAQNTLIKEDDEVAFFPPVTGG